MRIIRSAVLAIIAIVALLDALGTTTSANGGFSNSAADLEPAAAQPADPELPPDP